MSDRYMAAVAGVYGKRVQRLFCDPNADAVVKGAVQALTYVPREEWGQVLSCLGKKKAALRDCSSGGGRERP